MENTENTCCGGKETCNEAPELKLVKTDVEQKQADMTAALETMKPLTMDELAASVLRLSMCVNGLQSELGAFAQNVQANMAEMYKAIMMKIEEIEKAIKPQ